MVKVGRVQMNSKNRVTTLTKILGLSQRNKSQKICTFFSYLV